MTPLAFVKEFQRRNGLDVDGIVGPATLGALDALYPDIFDRKSFLARFVNKSAPAITDQNIADAAERLNVSTAHIRMVMKVESRGTSFDNSGRPIILFEPHIFHRQTRGKYSPSSFSYPQWGDKPYPSSYDGRWKQLADAATVDSQAALESASWGLFQVMGFNWKDMGYPSVDAFVDGIVASEAAHLEAAVRYIAVNGLAPALRRCTKGDPESCRAFAKGYNGPGYAKNEYHARMAAAL